MQRVLNRHPEVGLIFGPLFLVLPSASMLADGRTCKLMG